KRYSIDNSHRELHGALLDAEILADVYLQLTGGQAVLSLEGAVEDGQNTGSVIRRLAPDRPPLVVYRAKGEELQQHAKRLQDINEASNDNCLWLKLF
ncbi:MAG: DNA polymerase III subunit epsilon, partial [Gammaproteobacteria bacterium]|nr:DNA polymerase III subunit epsilon [Gammaproteobacteria bacterium]